MTQEIRIENLRNHPKNIRKTYGNLKELTASIKENGVLQNLIVVPDPKNEGMYLVVAGNCRLRAAKKAGLETLPCNVTEMTEQEQVLTMLTENMQRNGLSIAEEAAGIQMCLEDFGMKVPEVAKATGLSTSTVRSRRNIAKLDLSTVKEKTMSSDFQLSITDLNSLSKVKDVDKRNEILADATDSKNLKWKVEQAVKDGIKEKNLAFLVSLLEEAGIELATEVESHDLYGSKWDTIKSFNLMDDAPVSLFDDGDEVQTKDISDLMYVIHYNYLRIIKKHKREKKQLTEAELAVKRIRKSRKEIKTLYKQMYAEMASFAQALMNGQLSKPDDPEKLLDPLWNVILKKGAHIFGGSIISIMSGKEYYEMTDTEMDDISKRARDLPLYQQMMALAVKGCGELELINYKGYYVDLSASILLALYSCLNSIGFTFSNEEYDQVMDGTHELYEPQAQLHSEEMEEDNVTDASDVEIEVGYDELPDESGDSAVEDDEADSKEGFEVLEEGEHNPFDVEPEMTGSYLEEKYPTVYSTEDRDSDETELSHEQVLRVEAA